MSGSLFPEQKYVILLLYYHLMLPSRFSCLPTSLPGSPQWLSTAFSPPCSMGQGSHSVLRLSLVWLSRLPSSFTLYMSNCHDHGFLCLRGHERHFSLHLNSLARIHGLPIASGRRPTVRELGQVCSIGRPHSASRRPCLFQNDGEPNARRQLLRRNGRSL
jgi:hypothetical protein